MQPHQLTNQVVDVMDLILVTLILNDHAMHDHTINHDVRIDLLILDWVAKSQMLAPHLS
jgi:hypothetical protein